MHLTDYIAIFLYAPLCVPFVRATSRWCLEWLVADVDGQGEDWYYDTTE